MPFYKLSFPVLTHAVSYTGTATAVIVGYPDNTVVVFSVNLQRLIGFQDYYLDETHIRVFAPDGSYVPYGDESKPVYWYYDFLPNTLGVSTGFTIFVDWNLPEAPDGTWIILIDIVDPNTGITVQTLQLRVRV